MWWLAGFDHPRPAELGWPKPPLGPWGWFGHPQGPISFLFFKSFFFLALGGGRTTLKGQGVASATPDRPPFAPNRGGRPPYFFLILILLLLF
jgi:hypothetical protein